MIAQYIARRVLQTIPVLLGVTVLVFLFLHIIPGDPAVAMLGERATDANVARIREQLGLNEPLPTQYAIFLSRILRGDLGESIHTHNEVAAELARRFPATVELALAAVTIAILVGVPAGVLAGARRNSALDRLTMIGSLVGVSMPIFWLGLMLLWFFAVQLPWFPTGARLDVDTRFPSYTNLNLIDSLIARDLEAFQDTLRHLALPALALGTIPMATIARMTRSAMLDVLGQDYVRTAWAKGLRWRKVILKHALRNAMLPVVTVVGLEIGRLMSGAVLTETIFSWPGIGKWIFDAITGRDYPIVQGAALLIAVIYVAMNLLVDLSYSFLDPRIRFE